MSNQSGVEWNKTKQAATSEFKSTTRRAFTEVEDDVLVEGRQRGATIEQLAFRLKRTWFSVQGRIAYLRRKGVEV